MNYTKEKREFRNKRYYFAEKCIAFISGLCLVQKRDDFEEYRKKFEEFYSKLYDEIEKEISFDEMIGG